MKETSDPARRPEITAAALAKAALQTTQRALFTAQLAAEAMAKLGDADARTMEALRDGLLDCLSAVPKDTREAISKSRATLTSDELIDLLALSVQGN